MSEIEITFQPSEQPMQMTFSVEIFDDDINEADQVFVLLLELMDATSPEFVDLAPRNACLVTIVDDDRK